MPSKTCNTAWYLCSTTFNSRIIAGVSRIKWSHGVAYQPEPDAVVLPWFCRVCENFLYRFKAAPTGRSHRRHGRHSRAPADALARLASTPVGWRERKTPGRLGDPEFQMCGGVASGSAIVRVGRNLSRAPTASCGSATPTLDRTRPRVAEFASIGSGRWSGQTPV